jgi:hypothetical protein
MRTIKPILALAALLAFAAPATAQSPTPQPGQRVMLLLRHGQPGGEGLMKRQIRGMLVAADSTSLSVEPTPGAAPVRVPRAVVLHTYVSLGAPSRGKSAGLGASLGIGTGMAATLTYMKDDTRSTGANAMIGAIGGALGGALAGALFPRERWSDARTPGGVSIAPTVTANSHGLAVNIRL